MTNRVIVLMIGVRLCCGLGSARAEQMEAGPGLSVSGAAQGLWQQVQADPGRGVEGVEEFRTRRVHLYFYGPASELMDFGFTLAYNDDTSVNLELGVYEAWLRFRLTDWWSIKAGSFLPPWSITMPRPVHELDFIRYPLIVDSGLPMLTPWRQTGLSTSFQIGDNLSIFTGLFDGLDREGEYMDNNNMKDTMVAVSFQAYPGLVVHLSHWGGKSVSDTALPGLGLNSVEYVNTLLGIEAERGHWRWSGESLWNEVDSGGSVVRQTQGYHFSTVYTRGQFQGLLRYEYLDPETSDSRAGADDEMEWTTIGINYLPTPSIKLMGAYIFKSERGDNQAANEELALQVSLAF